ncbi:hypothetical protein AAEU42_10015 [Pseudoflavonifractor phocaeensis]|uniref:hypothetical protein n=1 Tax=Pseudoflavonifractor phocaeensis TaxID=1870988 RepID=UPI00313C4247
MTYLEILHWARKGIQAEQKQLRELQDKAIEKQSRKFMEDCQEHIDELDVYLVTLKELEQIHNR